MRRRSRHLRVGELLAVLPGADPDAVAYHFGRAGDERAVAWLVRAGERAQRAYAWRNAADRFAAAAAGLEGEATRAGERGWLLYRVGRLLRVANPAQGIAYLEEAGRVAAAVEDPVLAAYALVDQGMLRCFAGHLRRGLVEMAAGTDALDTLLDEPAPSGAALAAWVADALPEPAHARVRAEERPPASGVNLRRGALVVWLAGAGYFAEADAMAVAQLAEAEEVARPDEAVLSSLGDLHYGLAQVASALGRPDAAVEALARARVAHRAIDHHFLLAADVQWELDRVHIPYRTTHLTERLRLRAEMEAILARIGGVSAAGQPLHPLYIGNLLPLLLLEGVWIEAHALVELTHVYASGPLWQYAAGELGRLARLQGLPELAWALVREELPDGPETEPGGKMYLPTVALLRVAAELALDADDRPTARAWLAAHDRWLAWSGAVLGQADGHLLWARYHQIGGETAQARHRAETALHRATEPRQPLALLHAHRRLGEIESAAGRTAEAAAHLDEALTLSDACAAPYERALTLLAFSELRAATGRAADARTAVDAARAICVPLHAALALARADDLASRLATAAPAGDHPAGLSARELEVLRLVAEGLTDAQVADRLSISPRTVGQHLRSVYNKLGVPSRAAATRFAVEHDLV
jgi:DNA-binding CsgD family transcriptional regulator/tetratricopeptide (TPR) repeat protein